jgi:hypothetical protein
MKVAAISRSNMSKAIYTEHFDAALKDQQNERWLILVQSALVAIDNLRLRIAAFE